MLKKQGWKRRGQYTTLHKRCSSETSSLSEATDFSNWWRTSWWKLVDWWCNSWRLRREGGGKAGCVPWPAGRGECAHHCRVRTLPTRGGSLTWVAWWCQGNGSAALLHWPMEASHVVPMSVLRLRTKGGIGVCAFPSPIQPTIHLYTLVHHVWQLHALHTARPWDADHWWSVFPSAAGLGWAGQGLDTAAGGTARTPPAPSCWPAGWPRGPQAGSAAHWCRQCSGSPAVFPGYHCHCWSEKAVGGVQLLPHDGGCGDFYE